MTDAAFLDEVAAFLETEGPHISTPKASKWSPAAVSGELSSAPSPFSSFHAIPSVKTSGVLVHIETNNKEEEAALTRQKRYRLRTKNERDELRRLEKELETKLETVKKEKQGTKTTARTDVVLTDSFWRDVAVQQRKERQLAEEERRRLVATINSQAAYMTLLTQSFRARGGDGGGYGAIGSSESIRIDDHKWLELKSSDTAAYAIYTEKIDASYALADRVYEECGMAQRPQGPEYSFHRRKEDGEIDYFQHSNKIFHPFTYRQTCDAMWELAGLPHRQEGREIYHDVADPSNTIAFKFRQTWTLSCGSIVSILKRIVCRRYEEAERTIFVWKIFLEGEGIFAGMDMTETGWVRVRPSPDGPQAIMEGCSRQVPVPFVIRNFDTLPVTQFQEVLEREARQDEVEVTKSLEKLMIEDTLNTKHMSTV